MKRCVTRIMMALLPIAALCGSAACSDKDNPSGSVVTEMSLVVNGERYDIALPATEAVDIVTLCREFGDGYLPDGEVVFDWWCSDHAEMVDWCSPIFDSSYDYVQFNSVQVLPDGNWFCSFRILNSLIKIDRANGTGDILWRIAGDQQAEPQSFYGQHYATLYDDGTLTLFDNGNGHDPQLTRVLRLQVNPETGEVVGGGNMLNPGGDYFTHACGAV